MTSNVNNSKIDEAVLALLWLNLSTTGTAWKGFDWAAMERLYDSGMISDPVGKAKSVQLTPEGRKKAENLFLQLFGDPKWRG